MSSLDIKQHGDHLISIKDLMHDIDISESKWNLMFDDLIKDSEATYFFGNRLNFFDNEYLLLRSHIAEEVFIDQSNFSKMLIRLKTISWMFNRKQLAKLWQYYEDPAIIILSHKADEVRLIEMSNDKGYYEDIFNTMNSSAVVYQGMESDVLWIRTN
jgi:hypothetical protein